MDIKRLKKLSGILTESSFEDYHQTVNEDTDMLLNEVIGLFKNLISDLESGNYDAEDLSGLAYHYEESLHNLLADHGVTQDDV